MARFSLLCFFFAAALTSSLTSAGDENHATRLVQIPPRGLQWIHFWNYLHGERFFLWHQSPKVDEITLLTINTSSSSSSYCPVHSRLSDL
ncbi:hypothetical protein HID58_072481 [Brassica napus]|uniref:Uncharacterized protein n=3 Tax=Brassica TaxID=3705 RepID=A0ABQ7Z4J0_BRANA|nr:hypothetical protein HID58_072481 [Brassica napus]CDY28896.1 BnaC06g26840D [Brassica napus]VDD63520.1 unnamed protein product [Brassica oleracea]